MCSSEPCNFQCASVLVSFCAAKQVLEFFREMFISEVTSKDIVHDLQHKDIIPDGVLTAVTRENGAALQNRILYAHLESTCTWESLMTLCETIIAVPGNPRMKRFGENMKSKLEGKWCVLHTACMCSVCTGCIHCYGVLRPHGLHPARSETHCTGNIAKFHLLV